MALNTNPGSQIQGINVQGLEINKNHVTINIEWIDPDTNTHFDPSTYSVAITHNGNAYSESNLTIMTPLSRSDETVGYWTYEFLTQSNVATPVPMAEGTYTFTFTGTNSDTGNTMTMTLGFTAASIPIAKYFVGSLRTKLGDRRTRRYLVDDPTSFRWTNGELYEFIEDSRLSICNTPPKPENFTLEQLYSDAHDLVLTGGFIYALESKGIFETFNKFVYNDELTLNLDRSTLYQNAQNLRNAWEQAKLRWKRDNMFHRVRAVGMASGRFPMYYTRVLSFLPNMQNVFYG